MINGMEFAVSDKLKLKLRNLEITPASNGWLIYENAEEFGDIKAQSHIALDLSELKDKIDEIIKQYLPDHDKRGY